jgi:hypothetical protein
MVGKFKINWSSKLRPILAGEVVGARFFVEVWSNQLGIIVVQMNLFWLKSRYGKQIKNHFAENPVIAQTAWG